MAQKSFHNEDSSVSSHSTDFQRADGTVNKFGYTLQLMREDSFPTPYFNQSASPPQTPPSRLPRNRTRRQSTTPVYSIEEDYTNFKTHAWTPPEEDGLSSADGSSVVNSLLFQEIPPKVPPSEFYKYIPNTLNDQQRMTQLILWSLRREFDKDKSPTTSSDESKNRANIISRQLKLRFMEELARGNIEINPSKPSANSTKQNPINLKRTERLNKLKAAVQEFTREEKEWKKCLRQYYDNMATSFDKEDVYPVAISPKEFETYMDDLDPEQVDFFYDHIKPNGNDDDDEPIKQLPIDELPMAVRQSVKPVEAVINHVDAFEHGARAELAHREYKRCTVIPGDDDIPSALENDETRKQKRLETAALLLKLLSTTRE